MPRPLATLLLIVTTVLWGFAFVAQKSAMADLGPFTFSAIRYTLGTLVMLPLLRWELPRRKAAIGRRELWLILLLVLSFFFGVYFQQAGLTMTTVTNGGFLTSLYVLGVPLLAFLAVRQIPHPIVWLGVPMAIIGVFLLNGARFDQFNAGDLLVLCSALCWAIQVLLIGYLSRITGLPITLSVLCFAVTAGLSTFGSLAFETWTVAAVAASWPEILYTGILSTAVAFTLQAIAQQYVPASNSAIVLSAESLFAALGGALVLGERLPAIGYAGAVLIFAAIILVEAVPILLNRRNPKPA